MDFIYYFENASLTLRVVEYLLGNPALAIQFVTVVHQVDGWVVRIKLQHRLPEQQRQDLSAVLAELGQVQEPDIRLRMALWSLETGHSMVTVMRRYRVAIVAHGHPNRTEIEEFRKQFVRGLGYCPETLV
ncbi:MAG: hypothetical protein AAGF24_00630 [Cyanobacteria bacterium P01_H01_bin.121]